MKRIEIYSVIFALIMGLLIPLQAQSDKKSPGPGFKSDGERKTIYKAPRDPKRMCLNREVQEQKRKKKDAENQAMINAGKKPSLLSNISLGNNPREGQYRAEMERLLSIEIANVQRSILDVKGKHKELIQLYPVLKNYQEIVLEDVPGAWRDGEYVNSKKLIIMHYDKNGEIECVVLDSMTRSIYDATQFTRKIMRLYYPHVQTLELESLRHNYSMEGTLEGTSPEIQLRALRLVFNNLRAALYSMDMMIAAFYDLREKQNSWQINL